MLKLCLLVATMICAPDLAAQKPVSLHYTITIDSADTSGFGVVMRIANAPRTFTLAARAHPEYDDKYWRYMQDFQMDGGQLTRRDSVRWDVRAAGDVVTVRYRLALPPSPAPRASWRAFITPQGGLVGGPHSFLYVLGAEAAAANVRLVLPRGWSAASGMPRNPDGSYAAADVFTLMESPIMVGLMRSWSFDVANTKHAVHYLRGAADTIAFDTTAVLAGFRRLAEHAAALFGSVPYDEYHFLVMDDAWAGGLEHPNSVTLGMQATELAENPHEFMRELGHEFFHTWNLMRFKPAEYRQVDYRVQPPVPSLWFSEGLTIMYGDLLQRRAGMTVEHPTRIDRVRDLIARYTSHPGYAMHSAEEISRVEYNSNPGALGDFNASTHLIGEVLGNMLDLVIRDATDGSRTSDDVLRLMNTRFAERGFTGADLERAYADVCACDVSAVFQRHVRGQNAIDFDRYLSVIGLRANVTWSPEVDQEGRPARDFRIRAWQQASDSSLRVMVFHPGSIWARAGLHTNDRVLSVNGVAVKTWPEFRAEIVKAMMGDTLRFVVERPSGRFETDVVMAGFDRPVVEIVELPTTTSRQRRLREQWSLAR